MNALIWIIRFNRLEAAVRRHVDAKEKSGFADEHDDALQHAFEAILKDIASEGNDSRQAGDQSAPQKQAD